MEWSDSTPFLDLLSHVEAHILNTHRFPQAPEWISYRFFKLIATGDSNQYRQFVCGDGVFGAPTGNAL
ncbi:hypothetical protein, partial [Pseudomonas syringae group genomosp. 7]|uniref:hypothetical protein n=1 Tax=Pseudomonas syringae group genomosp. 7 TaxID=251699 RepID=UPI001C817DE6